MKKVFLILAVLAIAVLLIRLMMSHEKNVRSVKEDFTIQAQKLYAEFAADEAAANEKYLNKSLKVTGVVAETVRDSRGNVAVRLRSNDPQYGVQCKLDVFYEHKRREFQKGEKLTLQGLCTGLAGDVLLVQCVEH